MAAETKITNPDRVYQVLSGRFNSHRCLDAAQDNTLGGSPSAIHATRVHAAASQAPAVGAGSLHANTLNAYTSDAGMGDDLAVDVEADGINMVDDSEADTDTEIGHE